MEMEPKVICPKMRNMVNGPTKEKRSKKIWKEATDLKPWENKQSWKFFSHA
jgi:hypothetical protein